MQTKQKRINASLFIVSRLFFPVYISFVEFNYAEAASLGYLCGLFAALSAAAVDGEGLCAVKTADLLPEIGGVHIDVDGIADVPFGVFFRCAYIDEAYAGRLNGVGECAVVHALEA